MVGDSRGNRLAQGWFAGIVKLVKIKSKKQWLKPTVKTVTISLESTAYSATA